MDFSRPAKRDEDAFFNHSLKMLGKLGERNLGKNEEIEKAVSEGRVPYDFVPSGKPVQPTRKKKDYSSLHATYADVPPEEIEDTQHTVNASKSLEWAYYYLYHHGGVHFKSQLKDGTWIVEPAPRIIIETKEEPELDETTALDEEAENQEANIELPSRDVSLKALNEENEAALEDAKEDLKPDTDEDVKDAGLESDSGLTPEVELMLKNALKKYER